MAGFSSDNKNLGIKVGLDADGAISGLKNLIFQFGGLVLAYEAVKKAAEFFIGVIKDGIKAAGEQEVAVARLTSSLAAHGVTSKAAVQAQVDYADALSKTTTYTKNSIISMESQLAVFGLTGQALKDGTRATIELAAAKTIDLSTAALTVGKAFEGETMMLKRQGIEIDQSLPKGEKFAAVLKAIAGMGNVAEAQANTLSGSITKLHNRFEEIEKTIGEAFVPVLKDMIIPALNNTANAIEHFLTPQRIATAVGEIKKLFVDIQEQIDVWKEIAIDALASPFKWEIYQAIFDELISKIKWAFDRIKDLLGWLVQKHKEAVAEIESSHTTLQDRIVAAHKKAADKRSEIDKQTVTGVKSSNKEIDNNAGQTAASVVQHWYDSSTNMIGLGKAFATDFKGGLSKGVDEAFFGEGGIVEQSQGNFKSMFGSIGGEFVSGALGGIVVSGITSIITEIFGAKPTETVSQFAENAFQTMIDKTNKALDDLGKTKTTEDKQLSILGNLNGVIGPNGKIMNSAIAKALGVDVGTTVSEAQKIILNQSLSTNAQINRESQKKVANYQNIVGAFEDLQVGGYRGLTDQDKALLTEATSADFSSYLSYLKTRPGQVTFQDLYKKAVDDLSKAKEDAQASSIPSLDNLAAFIDYTKNLNTLNGNAPETGFASGGVVPGNSFTGDKLFARVNSGEMILNKSQQEAIFGGGGTTINFNGGIFMGDRKQAQQLAKMIDQELVVLSRQRQRLAA